MHNLVPSQITVSLEHLVTVSAGELGLFIVCQQVGLQVGSLAEQLATGGASVRSSIKVKDLVDSQSAGLAKALATLFALERLIFGVDVLVVPKMVLTPKCLFANVTSVWPFVSVSSFVDQQVV